MVWRAFLRIFTEGDPGATEPDVLKLATFFGVLYFLMATQVVIVSAFRNCVLYVLFSSATVGIPHVRSGGIGLTAGHSCRRMGTDFIITGK